SDTPARQALGDRLQRRVGLLPPCHLHDPRNVPRRHTVQLEDVLQRVAGLPLLDQGVGTLGLGAVLYILPNDLARRGGTRLRLVALRQGDEAVDLAQRRGGVGDALLRLADQTGLGDRQRLGRG